MLDIFIVYSTLYVLIHVFLCFRYSCSKRKTSSASLDHLIPMWMFHSFFHPAGWIPIVPSHMASRLKPVFSEKQRLKANTRPTRLSLEAR